MRGKELTQEEEQRPNDRIIVQMPGQILTWKSPRHPILKYPRKILSIEKRMVLTDLLVHVGLSSRCFSCVFMFNYHK